MAAYALMHGARDSASYCHRLESGEIDGGRRPALGRPREFGERLEAYRIELGVR